MYHDAMLQFKSPTINLTIPDFLDFCENLRYNLQQQLFFSTFDSKNRPVCLLGSNIRIVMHHYSSKEEALACWEKRTKRINDHIFIVSTDEFIKTEQDFERFNALDYPKVCFVSKPFPYDWAVFIPKYADCKSVGDITKVTGIFGKRIFEKYFNYIDWINCNYEKYYKN